MDDKEESPSSPEIGKASNGSNVEGAKSKKDKYSTLLVGDSTKEGGCTRAEEKEWGCDIEVTYHTGLSELSEKLL